MSSEIGGDAIDRDGVRPGADRQNPFFCPDAAAAERWEEAIDEARKAGSSLGAVVECVATGVPAGWGAPIYAKLDADLAARDDGHQRGQGRRDRRRVRRRAPARRAERRPDAARARTAPSSPPTTRAASPAGISTGQPVVVRVAFKPTSSILIPQDTITREGEATELATKGRHDPCVGMRGTPVVAAMMALVLADHKLLHRAQCG